MSTDKTEGECVDINTLSMNSEESGRCVKEIVECIEILSHPNEIKQTNKISQLPIDCKNYNLLNKMSHHSKNPFKPNNLFPFLKS